MIKFDKNVSTELQELLIEELKEYEKEMKMTKEERKNLHEWVSMGHSPYENSWSACYEGGYPVDYLSAEREMREELEYYESLTDEEKSNYRGYTMEYDTENEPDKPDE